MKTEASLREAGRSEKTNRSKKASQLSVTEQALNDREVVRELLEKSRRKCLTHNHEALSSETKIYREFGHVRKREGGSLPVSRSKKEIKNIYSKITEEQKPWETVLSISKAKQRYLPPKRSTVKSQRDPSTTKTISLSGLTTYNFSSIKARHRLAFNPQAAEQEVEQNIETAQQKAHASNERSMKIHMRTEPDEVSQRKEMDSAITHSYPDLGTTEYLRGVQKWRDQNKVVYGERRKHLNFMSTYMGDENQEQAEFLVEQIKLSVKNQKSRGRRSIHRQKMQSWRREERELMQRRRPVGNRKICVSHT